MIDTPLVSHNMVSAKNLVMHSHDSVGKHETEPTWACWGRTLMPSYRATYAPGRQGDWNPWEPPNVEQGISQERRKR